MSRIPIDPDSDVVEQHYAVIYSPRRHRDRFPDNCVSVVESEDAARAQAEPDKNFYAARVGRTIAFIRRLYAVLSGKLVGVI